MAKMVRKSIDEVKIGSTVTGFFSSKFKLEIFTAANKGDGFVAVYTDLNGYSKANFACSIKNEAELVKFLGQKVEYLKHGELKSTTFKNKISSSVGAKGEKHLMDFLIAKNTINYLDPITGKTIALRIADDEAPRAIQNASGQGLDIVFKRQIPPGVPPPEMVVMDAKATLGTNNAPGTSKLQKFKYYVSHVMDRALKKTQDRHWPEPTLDDLDLFDDLKALDRTGGILKIKAEVFMTGTAELNKTITKRGKYYVQDGIRYVPWKHT